MRDFDRISEPELLTEDGQKVQPPKGTVLFGYRGSIAHGMYVSPEEPGAIDDVDLMGFVIPEVNHYLGLKKWGNGGKGTVEQWVGRYDCVYYELRKAFDLLLGANPNVLGMLWLRPEHYIGLNGVGREILAKRDLFSSKKVYNAFTGYAYGQLKKMEVRDKTELEVYLGVTEELKRRGKHPNQSRAVEQAVITPWSIKYKGHTDRELLVMLQVFQKKGENIGYLGDKRKRLVLEHGYDTKNAAHCIRLLRMGCEFIETGVLNVFRTWDRDELLSIKRGEWNIDRVKDEAEDLFDRAERALGFTDLPDTPNVAELEHLLIEIIGDNLEWQRQR